MSQTLDSMTLPNYANDGFQEIHDPVFSKNITLNGTLYVDTTGTFRSGWRITYKTLTAAEYNAIRAKYEKQFENQVFLNFSDDRLGINTSCFLSMPRERNIKWNGGYVEGLVITLEPQSADSL